MRKKYEQTMKVILASTIIASTVGTTHRKVEALTVHEIYAKAYNTTVNAMNARTQKSINEARLAIEAMRGTGAAWAIGEFSKQVDQVQHPFLVTIVDAITRAQKTIAQSDINTARATIDPELPQKWRSSYSSALDLVQQDILKQLVVACDLAVQDNTSGTIERVLQLVHQLKTAPNSEIGAWAEEIAKPLLESLSDVNIENLYKNIAQREMVAGNNIQNFGSVATDGIWEYRSKLDNGENKLYKIKLDGSESIKLSDDTPSYINVSGDWIYYTRIQGLQDMGTTIYKVKKDGTNRTKVHDAGKTASSVRVVGDWIYYTTSGGGTPEIHKVRIDGTGYTKITIKDSSVFLSSDFISVIGDSIYTVCYKKQPDTNILSSHIYKIKVDGSEAIKIDEDYSYRLNVLEDWIYYQNPNDRFNIYKIKIDGSEKTKLTNYGPNEVYVYSFIATNQGVFYSVHNIQDYNDPNIGIYKVSHDGSTVTKITNSYARFINSIENWIYFEGENVSKLRIMTDGTNLQKLN